jgi:hypothetical protein
MGLARASRLGNRDCWHLARFKTDWVGGATGRVVRAKCAAKGCFPCMANGNVSKPRRRTALSLSHTSMATRECNARSAVAGDAPSARSCLKLEVIHACARNGSGRLRPRDQRGRCSSAPTWALHVARRSTWLQAVARGELLKVAWPARKRRTRSLRKIGQRFRARSEASAFLPWLRAARRVTSNL